MVVSCLKATETTISGTDRDNDDFKYFTDVA